MTLSPPPVYVVGPTRKVALEWERKRRDPRVMRSTQITGVREMTQRLRGMGSVSLIIVNIGQWPQGSISHEFWDRLKVVAANYEVTIEYVES